jgi:subtilisin family serine protease/subtilisin-like proprotein convertase family protein
MFRPLNLQRHASCTRDRAQPPLGLEWLEDRTLLSTTNDLLYVATVPNDPRFAEQWAHLNTGQSGRTANDDIRSTKAWDVTTGSRKVVVSVMDTGIDYNHPDLYRNIWLNQAEIPPSRKAKLLDIDGDGLITFADLNDTRNQGAFKITDLNRDGRITAADTLAPMGKTAGADNGTGGWADGMSQNGDTYVDDLVGWNFVTNTNDPLDDYGHGTRVAGVIGATGNDGVGVAGVAWQVSLMPLKFMDSTGRGTISRFIAALNYAVAQGVKISNNSWIGANNDVNLLAALQNARAKGHIFVAAAGNNGRDIDQTPIYPASFAFDNVVTVAATDSNGQLTSYSNFGATSVDLAAPGQAILTTARNKSYTVVSGTSLSTPFVAGALALVWTKNPGWSYTQVINQVLKTVDPLPVLKGKTAAGGRLNLAAAVGYVPWARIVERTFLEASPGTFNTVRVKFSKQMVVDSFNSLDVKLIGPNGKAIPVAAVKVVDAPANRTFDIVFPTQTTPGRYFLTIGPNVVDPLGVPMKLFSTLYTLKPVFTFSSTTSVSIPDGGAASSSVTVNQDLIINQVTLRLNITHGRVSDLYIYLQAPDGTIILLSNRRGGSGQNFTNTVFDDYGSQSIRMGQAPFTGTFQSEGALSNLKTRNARGTWQLWVQDKATGMVGQIVNWSLTIE